MRFKAFRISRGLGSLTPIGLLLSSWNSRGRTLARCKWEAVSYLRFRVHRQMRGVTITADPEHQIAADFGVAR